MWDVLWRAWNPTAPSRGAALPSGKKKNSVWIFWDPWKSRKFGPGYPWREAPPGTGYRAGTAELGFHGVEQILLIPRIPWPETIPKEAPHGELQEKRLPLP